VTDEKPSLEAARPGPGPAAPAASGRPASPLSPSSSWANGAHPFFSLATLALLVAIFARAQEVLIPLALSVVVAFALTPAVTWLEKRLGRGLAVALVVLLALGAVVGFGLALRRQLNDLSDQMSRYSESMRRKVASLRTADQVGLAGLSRVVNKVVLELDEKVAENRNARPVRIVPAEATAFERIQGTLEPLLKPTAEVIIVLVLVIFLLAQREDLRDRFIRLLGRRNVSLTTRTLDDAASRISRFLVVQSAINGAFGVVVGLGLLVIGVPYAPLWGFVAALLRFIPFIGTVLGLMAPTLLAFAVLEGWWPTLATAGMFMGLDTVAAYVVEPMAIGRRTGVSSLAMVVMAICWTWLWGPAGLVLSTPLTVCLAVLGRRVPRFEFLAILLGDEPPLEPELVFYQRLLAHDEDEAAGILERALRTASPAGSPEQALDRLAIPALLLAAHDRARGEISESDHQEMLRTMGALIAGLTSDDVAAPPAALPSGAPPGVLPSPRPLVLGVAARTRTDELVWEMLARLLDPARVECKGLGAEALVSEVAALTEAHPPDLVCIASCGPGGLAQVRYLCKRLRSRRPGVRILVVRPSASDEAQAHAHKLVDEGVARVAFTLGAAQATVVQLLSLDAAVEGDRPAA
jgi:predicted PurR-regulated permease PerM